MYRIEGGGQGAGMSFTQTPMCVSFELPPVFPEDDQDVGSWERGLKPPTFSRPLLSMPTQPITQVQKRVRTNALPLIDIRGDDQGI